MTQEYLKTICHYNEKDGKLYWKVDMRPRGKKGNEVGYVLQTGYRFVGIKGKRYLTHRLVWLYNFGVFPHMIDHIDHNTLNNKLCNLREANYSINQKNMKMMKNNTSGVTGVYFIKASKVPRWRVTIWDKNKEIRLGNFTSKEEAIKVRKEAEVKYGYHPNHGS